MKQRKVIQASARRVWFTTQRKHEKAQTKNLTKDSRNNPEPPPRKQARKY